MINVFILAEGGTRGGFGHVTRCASLYQAFEEQGIKPQLLINGDDSLAPVVKGQNYLISNWLECQDELFRMISGADLVILDSYKADLSFYERVSEMTKIPVYFDDMLRLNYPRGIVVNGAVGAEDLPYPRNSAIHYLLGSRYFPLRREFWDAPGRETQEKIEAVLVTFGGSDERNMTPRVLQYLSEYQPDLSKIIVVGNGFKNVEEIQKAADPKTRLVNHPNGHTLKKEMLKSDLAISAAGQTLYELAYLGVPTVTVAVVDNQMGNIRGFLGAGFIEYAGSWDNPELLPKMEDCLVVLNDKKVRAERKAIGRALIGSRGSREIVDYCRRVYLTESLVVRKIEQKDIHKIFELSNEGSIREISFYQEPISWENHEAWFQKKLRDPNSLCLVAEAPEGLIGQVRFDVQERKAFISISVDKIYRGVGLGKTIMQKSLAFLKGSFPAVEIVRAQIREENTASIKYFESCGFRFLRNFVFNGIKAVEYLYPFEESGHEL